MSHSQLPCQSTNTNPHLFLLPSRLQPALHNLLLVAIRKRKKKTAHASLSMLHLSSPILHSAHSQQQQGSPVKQEAARKGSRAKGVCLQGKGEFRSSLYEQQRRGRKDNLQGEFEQQLQRMVGRKEIACKDKYLRETQQTWSGLKIKAEQKQQELSLSLKDLKEIPTPQLRNHTFESITTHSNNHRTIVSPFRKLLIKRQSSRIQPKVLLNRDELEWGDGEILPWSNDRGVD